MASIWDEFEHDPRQAEHSGLRAADKDRDVVRRALGDAYADGRLDREELDTRTDQVLAARTLGELPPLLGDLVPMTPASDRAPATRHEEAVRAYAKDRKDAVWTFLSVSLICWVIWLVTSWDGGNLDPYFPWPLFAMLGTGINLGRTVFMKDEMIASNERSLERKERKALAKKERSPGQEQQRPELDPPQ